MPVIFRGHELGVPARSHNGSLTAAFARASGRSRTRGRGFSPELFVCLEKDSRLKRIATRPLSQKLRPPSASALLLPIHRKKSLRRHRDREASSAAYRLPSPTLSCTCAAHRRGIAPCCCAAIKSARLKCEWQRSLELEPKSLPAQAVNVLTGALHC